MSSIARQTITYSAQGIMPIVLCRYDDNILTSQITRSGTTTIQRSSILGSSWIDQQARGNASISMSLGVATCHNSPALAEAVGEDMQLILLSHPQGLLTIQSCFNNASPLRTTTYVAGIDSVTPEAISSDNHWGARRLPQSQAEQSLNKLLAVTQGTTWLNINYEIILTNPQLL